MVREPFYTVIEIQNNGTPAQLTTFYTDRNQALSKYYTILAAAAISQLAFHAGYIIRDDGVMIEGRVFDRREDPGPEPEEA